MGVWSLVGFIQPSSQTHLMSVAIEIGEAVCVCMGKSPFMKRLNFAPQCLSFPAQITTAKTCIARVSYVPKPMFA